MRILTLLIALLLFCAHVAMSQINFEYSNHTMKILPYSVVKSSAKIYADSIWSEMADCLTPDRDTADFHSQPWIGNNQYLFDFLDSLGYPLGGDAYRGGTAPYTRYKIPLKFYVYRNSNGTGGADVVQIRTWIDFLNERHRSLNTGMQFYMVQGITFVNNSSLTVVGDIAAISNWLTGRHVNQALNIHVVRDVKGSGGFSTTFPEQAIFLDNSTFVSPMTHEIGHALGLDHTHQFHKFRGWPFQECFVEPVDRNRKFSLFSPCIPITLFTKSFSKCDATGDGLCDTPADPTMGAGDLNALNHCVWDSPNHQKDIYGDSYQNPPSGSSKPDPRNVMSYGPPDCRANFTYSQIGVMVHSIERGFNQTHKNEWTDPDVSFDILEPDNELAISRDVAMSETTTHTFHTDYSGNLYNDVDWISFTANATISYTIKTFFYAGTNSADTEIKLYDTSGTPTLIATDDNSGGSNFSRIVMTLPVGSYAVEITNKNTSLGGGYSIAVYPCFDPTASYISGPATVCGSSNSTFVMNNLPSGVTGVSWSHSSNLAYVSGDGTTSYTVTGYGSGVGYVSAQLTGSCLSESVSIPQLSVHIGGYGSGDYPVYGPSSSCQGQSVYYSTEILPDATYYDWTWPSDWSYVGGQGTRYLDLIAGTSSGYVEVRVANPCDSGGSPGSQFTSVSSCYRSSPDGFNIFPNPVSDELTIEMSSDSLDNSKTARSKAATSFEIHLYNNSGKEVISAQSTGRSITIPVREYPNGLYSLVIFYKEAVLQRQIVISKK